MFVSTSLVLPDISSQNEDADFTVVESPKSSIFAKIPILYEWRDPYGHFGFDLYGDNIQVILFPGSGSFFFLVMLCLDTFRVFYVFEYAKELCKYR